MTPKQLPKKQIEGMVEAAFTRVEGAVARGLQSGNASIGALFELWLVKSAKHSELAHPTRRAPATQQQIEVAEKRIGCSLPVQLKALYQSSDGTDWIIPKGAHLLPRQGYFPPLSELRIAEELSVPFSTILAKTTRKSSGNTASGNSVKVVKPSLWAFLQEPEQTLLPQDLDSFLALQLPTKATCLLMAHMPMFGLAAGAALDFEGGIASRYENLAQWLSVQLELEF
jgi:hypothetical protein